MCVVGGRGALLRSDRRGTRAAAEARVSDAAVVLGGQAFVVHSPEGPLPAPPLVDFPLFLRHHQERARGNEETRFFGDAFRPILLLCSVLNCMSEDSCPASGLTAHCSLYTLTLLTAHCTVYTVHKSTRMVERGTLPVL